MNEEDLKYESEFWFLYFEELKRAIWEEETLIRLIDIDRRSKLEGR